MKNENKVIKILEKYDFVRPADRTVIKANISSKARVYKKIMKQESGWSFASGYAYSLFSILRNYGFSVNMSSARRFAQVSFVAASFVVILGGALTVNNYLNIFNGAGKQPEIAKDQSTIVPLTGMISFTIGTVTKKDNAGNLTTANAGDAVTEGMIITTTGKKSTADIFVGENAVRITGDSTITLSRLTTNSSTGTQQVAITLVNGLIYNKITRKLIKDDVYNVSTGTATAAVRGTEFAVEDIKGKTTVSCLKGRVAVNNNAGAVVVIEANEETAVTEGKDPVKSLIDDNKLKKLQILSDIKAAKEDIRIKFETQREEIKKAVEDQKTANTQSVENQKSSDAARIEKIKSSAGKTPEDKKATEEALDKPVNSVKAQMEALKKKPTVSGTK